MEDLLSEFENSLNNFFITRNYKVSLRRCTHECERCDYSVFISSFSSEECFGKTVLEVMEPAANSSLVSDLIAESTSWKFKIKDIQTSNNYIYIYLNKEDVFYNSFNEVLKHCTEYGTSSVFQDKVFLLTNDLMNNPPLTLTELRVKLSAAILRKVLIAGTAIVTENSSSEKIYKQIHISHKTFKKSSETMGHEAFKFLLVAPVSKDGHVSPTSYKKKIKENLLENEVNSGRSDEELDTLVDAVILFDLFKSKLSKNVKLTDHLNADRGAIFSIYNYARLRLILDTFEEKCSSGIYPKLPQLEELDFSLLMDEDEWRLVFDYVLAWPSVLSVVLKSLDGYDDCNHDCKIHLLVNFMQTLSFSVSSYYSRIQILREPRPQLLLYLFARIYLLKVVVKVMDNCFAILGIKPLSRM